MAGSDLSTKSYEETKEAYEKAKTAVDNWKASIEGVEAVIETTLNAGGDIAQFQEMLSEYEGFYAIAVDEAKTREDEYYELAALAVEMGKEAGCETATGNEGPDQPSQCSIDAWNEEVGGVPEVVSGDEQDLEEILDAEQAASDAAAAADLKRKQEEMDEDDAGFSSKVLTATHEYKEQCFLLGYVKELASYKKDLDKGLIEDLGVTKPLPYTGDNAAYNASLLLDGDPFGYINKLTLHSNQKAFFNMETKDISKLQPMIRLFKIIEDAETGEETQQEITFDSYLTPSDLDVFKNKRNRGVGVGIKSFDFSFEGQNNFALTKCIKANLNLFANNFEELLRDRVAEDGTAYKYIDLALKTGGNQTANFAYINKTNPQLSNEQYDNLAKLNFRLKAIVGWALPSESGGVDGSVRDAIYDSYITLNLSPVTHEFKLREDGRLDFAVHYYAYVEDFFNQSDFNIFSDPAINARRVARKMQTLAYNLVCDDESNVGLKKDQKEQIQQDLLLSYQTLLSSLLKSDKVYSIPIPYDKMNSYLATAPDYDFSNFVISPAPKEDLEAIEEVAVGRAEEAQAPEAVEDGNADAASIESGSESDADVTEDGSSTKIVTTTVLPSDFVESEVLSFFYVSDLIDLILNRIESSMEETIAAVEALDLSAPAAAAEDERAADIESQTGEDVETSDDIKQEEIKRLKRFREEFKKFRVLLGPLEIVDPKNEKQTVFVTLGDIPISVRYFTQWLTDKVLARQETIYPLTIFLNTFISQLMRDFMNNDSCFNGRGRQKVFLFENAITSYRDEMEDDEKLDNVTQAILKHGTGARLNIENGNVPFPILNVAGERGAPDGGDQGKDREIYYLAYYVGRTQPTELMNGIREEDEQKSLFHYGIGRNNGIVKSISFSKVSAPKLKMVRFEQAGYDGLQQLREQYLANIETYANVNAMPGDYIFIEPDSFAPSSEVDLTQLGVGGYHMITRSEHSFGQGYANSKLVATWVAEISNPDATTAAKSNVEEEEEYTPMKCYYTDRSVE